MKKEDICGWQVCSNQVDEYIFFLATSRFGQFCELHGTKNLKWRRPYHFIILTRDEYLLGKMLNE